MRRAFGMEEQIFGTDGAITQRLGSAGTKESAYKQQLQLRNSQLGGDQRNAAPHKACITGKHQECRRQYF